MEGTPSQPPSPRSSDKRILIAFLLCFTGCGHRIYAGKTISGLVQMVMIFGPLLLVCLMIAPAIAFAMSDPVSVNAVSPTIFYPLIISIGTCIWVAVDAARIISGKFKDGRGNKITQWV